MKEGAGRAAEAEKASCGARVFELEPVVGTGGVKVAEVPDAADGTHELQLGGEILRLDGADQRRQQPGVRVENAAEHDTLELDRGDAVLRAIRRGERRRHRASWCVGPGRRATVS